MRKLHIVNIDGKNIGFSEKKHAAQLLALLPNAIKIETNYDNPGDGYRTSLVESTMEASYSFGQVMTENEYETAKKNKFETVPKKKDDDIKVEDIPF